MLKAPVSEIFYSYQGEGIYVGQPQVFVRFSGCNIACDYCDTPQEKYKLLTAKNISRQIQKLLKKHLNSRPRNYRPTVSITGGEPLIHKEFLSELLPELKKLKCRIYLETNGTLPEALKDIVRNVDVVSMDIKGKPFWKKHREFLKIAKNKVFIKMVLTDSTEQKDVYKAVKLIKDVSSKIPFVFQPATPTSGCRTAEPVRIFDWIKYAKGKLCSVYMVPQMHKIWRIR